MQRRLWPQQLENNQVTLSKLGGKVTPYQEFHTLTQGLAIVRHARFQGLPPSCTLRSPQKRMSSKRRERARNEKTSDPQTGDPAQEGGRGTRWKMGRGGPRRWPCSVPPRAGEEAPRNVPTNTLGGGRDSWRRPGLTGEEISGT